MQTEYQNKIVNMLHTGGQVFSFSGGKTRWTIMVYDIIKFDEKLMSNHIFIKHLKYAGTTLGSEQKPVKKKGPVLMELV